MKMDGLYKVSYALVLIGGLNWGLVGLFDYNLVDSLFGTDSGLTNFIYILVGFGATALVWMWFANRGKKRA